jgi:hypothetical protein
MRLPLWSSGQSCWLQIQGFRVRLPALIDFLWSTWSGSGPLSLVSITEELLDWRSRGSGIENWDCGRGDPLRWPHNTLYPQKLALTSPTCGGRSGGIVRLRTKATEFSLILEWACHGDHAICDMKDFNRRSTGFVGSNPSRGMNVCVFVLCLRCPVYAVASRWLDRPVCEIHISELILNWQRPEGRIHENMNMNNE